MQKSQRAPATRASFMKIYIFLFFLTAAFGADQPTAIDALAQRTIEVRLLSAQVQLAQMLEAPEIIQMKAEIAAASQALDAEHRRHPTCQLLRDSTWKCGDPATEPAKQVGTVKETRK